MRVRRAAELQNPAPPAAGGDEARKFSTSGPGWVNTVDRIVAVRNIVTGKKARRSARTRQQSERKSPQQKRSLRKETAARKPREESTTSVGSPHEASAKKQPAHATPRKMRLRSHARLRNRSPNETIILSDDDAIFAPFKEVSAGNDPKKEDFFEYAKNSVLNI